MASTERKPPIYKFCRTRDLIAVYVRVCPRSLEETVVRGVDVERPSKSEREIEVPANTGIR